jgi:ribonuclease HI
MTIEVIAVTRAMACLETKSFHRICFLSDSMSMTERLGLCVFEWLEAIERSRLTAVLSFFDPDHEGVKGNERADRLTDMAVNRWYVNGPY